MFGDIWLSERGGRRCCWHPGHQESRKRPAVHMTVPPTKNPPAPVVRSAEVRNPALKLEAVLTGGKVVGKVQDIPVGQVVVEKMSDLQCLLHTQKRNSVVPNPFFF